LNLETVHEDVNVRKVKTTVPANEIRKSLETEMKKTQKNAQFAGFRKGKVPLRLLFPPEHVKVLEEKTAWDLLEIHLDEERKTGSLQDLIYPPIITEASKAEMGDYNFQITLFAQPQIQLPELSNMMIRREKIQEHMIDQAVEERVKEHREEYAILHPVDRPCQWGDQISLTYQVHNAEGRMIFDSPAITYRMDIEDHNPLVQAALGKAKSDQFSIERSFEKEGTERVYSYNVQINEVQHREYLPLDDSFPKEVGLDFENLHEMKEAWRNEIRDSVEERYRTYYLPRASFEELVLQSEMITSEEVPMTIVKESIEKMTPEEKSAYMKELTVDDDDSFIQKLKDQLMHSWKRKFVAEAFSKANGLSIQEEEVDQFLDNRAAMIGLSGKQMKEYLVKRNEMGPIREEVIQMKIGTFMIDLVQWDDSKTQEEQETQQEEAEPSEKPTDKVQKASKDLWPDDRELIQAIREDLQAKQSEIKDTTEES